MLYMYICTFIHKHIYIHPVYANIYTNTHMCIHNTYTYICNTQTHTNTYTHIHTYTHTHIHTYTHTHIHTYTHTHIHTYTHTHIHTYTHTHIHTYTHTRTHIHTPIVCNYSRNTSVAKFRTIYRIVHVHIVYWVSVKPSHVAHILDVDDWADMSCPLCVPSYT